jgi:hypothetical protein
VARLKFLFFLILFFTVLAGSSALPYIPGCPLHDSCVRAFKQEQRQRQREQRQRESPDATQTTGNEDADEGNVKKPLGIILGFQLDLGDFVDRKNDYINLRPSLAYMNGFGSLDLFLSVFYTLSIDDPGLSPVVQKEKLQTLSRAGLNANIGYTFDLSESLTLAAGLDNQNQFDFTADVNPLNLNGNILSYAVLEPSLAAAYALEFGDISLTNSFPFAYASDMALDYTISASFNAIAGFGITLSGYFWNLWVDPDSEYGQTKPPFQYGETELIFNFYRGPFFASLSLTADGAFRQFSVEPYLSYRIKNLTVFAVVIFANLGEVATYEQMRLNKIMGKRDVSSVIPSIGVKYRL